MDKQWYYSLSISKPRACARLTGIQRDPDEPLLYSILYDLYLREGLFYKLVEYISDWIDWWRGER